MPKRTYTRPQQTPGEPYGTARWESLAKRFKTAQPLCQICLHFDTLTDCAPGTGNGVSDHVIRIKDGGSVYDEANIITMCRSHHSRKSAIELTEPIRVPSVRNDYGELIPADKAEAIAIIANRLTPWMGEGYDIFNPAGRV